MEDNVDTFQTEVSCDTFQHGERTMSTNLSKPSKQQNSQMTGNAKKKGALSGLRMKIQPCGIRLPVMKLLHFY